ncbi:MAG TPA: universal stress protein, partial [Coriobacteriia bacterium]
MPARRLGLLAPRRQVHPPRTRARRRLCRPPRTVAVDVIVVGVDGSAHSVVALRYALREAKAHDYVVRAVAAWHVPTLVYGGAGLIPT